MLRFKRRRASYRALHSKLRALSRKPKADCIYDEISGRTQGNKDTKYGVHIRGMTKCDLAAYLAFGWQTWPELSYGMEVKEAKHNAE